MKNHPRTIFLVVQSGFGARYLLRTAIFDELKAGAARIVILTPNTGEDYFKEEFAHTGVFIERLETEKCAEYLNRSPLQKMLRRIRLQSQGHPEKNRTIAMARKLYRDTAGVQRGWRRLRQLVEDAAVRCLSRSRTLRRGLIRAEYMLFTPHFHRRLYERYRPGAVVTTSLGYWHPDDYILREAKSNGVPIVPLVLSWDNTSSYGMPALPPDRVIAWTETMKEELVFYHDVPPDRIFVGGIAHFDDYYHPERSMDRQSLCRQLGLDPEKRVIFFATKSPNSYPWNREIAEIIARAIQEGAFADPCQLLVRLHPIHYRYRGGIPIYGEELKKYRELAKRYSFVSINEPVVMSKRLSMDSTREEMGLVQSILTHADVMVNLFSTMTIEASILDLPSINVAFEGDPRLKRKPRDSIAFDEAQTHNQRVIQTGGVAMARSPEQLIRLIDAYLRHPELDREGRWRIRRQEGGANPGSAGSAIGHFLLALITKDGDENEPRRSKQRLA